MTNKSHLTVLPVPTNLVIPALTCMSTEKLAPGETKGNLPFHLLRARSAHRLSQFPAYWQRSRRQI